MNHHTPWFLSWWQTEDSFTIKSARLIWCFVQQVAAGGSSLSPHPPWVVNYSSHRCHFHLLLNHTDSPAGSYVPSTASSGSLVTGIYHVVPKFSTTDVTWNRRLIQKSSTPGCHLNWSYVYIMLFLCFFFGWRGLRYHSLDPLSFEAMFCGIHVVDTKIAWYSWTGDEREVQHHSINQSIRR